MLTLEVAMRDMKESPEEIRVRGAMPAVFYGAKEPSTPIVINARKMASRWKEAGETTVISLTGAVETKESLIRDVQFHPVTGSLLHVDFYVLEKGKKVELAVPIEFSGTAPAERAGHVVVKSLHEIEIEVLPAELPRELVVDISKLENVGDRITVADIVLPPSAELKTNPEEVVVSVAEFKEEKIEEPAPIPAEGATAPEVAAEGATPEGGEPQEKQGEQPAHLLWC